MYFGGSRLYTTASTRKPVFRGSHESTNKLLFLEQCVRFVMPSLAQMELERHISVSIPPFEAIFWKGFHRSMSADAADCSYVGNSPQGLSYLCIFSRNDGTKGDIFNSFSSLAIVFCYICCNHLRSSQQYLRADDLIRPFAAVPQVP